MHADIGTNVGVDANDGCDSVSDVGDETVDVDAYSRDRGCGVEKDGDDDDENVCVCVCAVPTSWFLTSLPTTWTWKQ